MIYIDRLPENADWIKHVPVRKPRALGGPGSGNFGHAGRPGERGGSAPSGAAVADPAQVADLAARMRPEALDAAYDNWAQSLSHDERAGFSSYTSIEEYGPHGHSMMNHVLQGKYDNAPRVAHLKAQAEKQAELLMKAIERAPADALPPLVWRGLDGDIDYEVGTEVQMKGFQSTSVSPHMAGNFGDTILEIKPTAGAYLSGKNLAGKFSLAEHPQGVHEREFLLPHNKTYRVTGVSAAVFGGKARKIIQMEML